MSAKAPTGDTADMTALREEVARMEKERKELIQKVQALAKELNDLDAASVQTQIHVNSEVSLSKLPKENLADLKRLKITDATFCKEDDATITTLNDLEWLTVTRCAGELDLSLVGGLKNLQHLEVSSCSCVRSWAPLGKMTALTHAYLDGSTLLDADLAELAKASNLAELSIVGCQNLTDISPLGSLAALESINANACFKLVKIGATGKLGGLRELCLNHTQVDNAAIQDIGANRSLFRLDLQNCATVTDFSPLSEVLTLTMLDLKECGTAQFPQFAMLPLLELLRLDNSGADDETIKKIATCMGLRLLSVENCIGVTDLSPLAVVPTLERVNATKCIALKEIKGFGSLPALCQVTLSCTDLSEEAFLDLAKSTSVTSLDVRQCGLTVNAVGAITKMKQLEELHIDDWPLKTGPISTLVSLKYLTVGGPEVTDDFMKDLAKADKLVSISLVECPNVSNVTPLGSIKSLLEVTLAHCDRVENISEFLAASELRRLVLEGSFVSDEMITHLGASKTLTELSLICCRRLTYIAALEVLKTLEDLTLAYCDNLTDIDSVRLVKSLQSLVLIHIDLPVNGMEAIGNSISLRYLHIDNCPKPIMLRSLLDMNVRDIRISNCAELSTTGLSAASKRTKSILIEKTHVLPVDRKKMFEMGINIH